ncbi:DinB family protein [Meiothermus taiwanensis]|jgi:uncharacterized damage-inducible protein DinB|uniref:Damage-inducible protein DinB n=1 Tax=Meiothermus taiwanensis WR-220 TaxID=1339250 RepID=A0ABM6WK09_9DEIN|nr:DinB family protein [Meiothermus taiwanensis]AWR87505.1 hypothetical protein Mtai_v1c22740 [Meiothermus taiwanensis WR-220]KIQ56084.1 hypothetical protein SY28_00290 [Meiothermus taiwanensis]KZK17005.1 hypothetical protein A3962_13555 [Meiothermus taiwanensis]
MNDDLRVFYGWVQRSREILFRYCESLPPEIYTQERSDFGYGSIRNLHVHVADCYLWWVGVVGMGHPKADLKGADFPNVAAVRAVFEGVDRLVEEALSSFDRLDEVYVWTHPSMGWKINVSQRWLLMHPITHEFHHKGQMLALGRGLGHPVPDSYETDLVSPSLSPAT